MKKVDFKRLMVEINFEGDQVEVDIRKQLANHIRQSTNDIGLDDFAKEIYYSEEAIEVPEEYIQPIISVSKACMIVPVQRALSKIFEQSKN